MRMIWNSARIWHDCRVWAKSADDYVYQYTKPKWNRLFWGHQSNLGGWYAETRGGWRIEQNQRWAQYDGRHHNGPFVVFDKDVPMDPKNSTVHIIPCITRPHIATEVYEHLNWYGQYGEWRPWGNDNVNAGYYSKSSGRWNTEDGAFLNNRYKADLGGFTQPGRYKDPKPPASVSISPTKIDVGEQDSKRVKGSWTAAINGNEYQPYISMKADHSAKIKLPKV